MAKWNWQQELARKDAEIERLRAALRPFVEYVHDDFRTGTRVWALMEVHAGDGGGWIGAEDLRRARAAYEGTGNEANPR